jgi:hypothetical protein
MPGCGSVYHRLTQHTGRAPRHLSGETRWGGQLSPLSAAQQPTPRTEHNASTTWLACVFFSPRTAGKKRKGSE